MTDLFWPGDERSDLLMTGPSFLEAIVQVENVWLSTLVKFGLAPPNAAADIAGLVSEVDLEEIARGAESGGNPVIGVVDLLRLRAAQPVANWVHRGLTSQDVIDTALMLCLADTIDRLLDELRSQIIALCVLAERHAADVMVGRTLTQHAVPTTFGAVAAAWLDGVLDAADLTVNARTSLPVQLGGAVGTLAATTELAALRGAEDAPSESMQMMTHCASKLGLRARRPWHTHRGPVTRAADALTSCTDAWGHIASDVTTLSRSEIAELAESAPNGRGGSSTMPGKRNPVLSVLVRRAAISMPGLGATLHSAAATSGDQRSEGGWHTEWATLATMGRRAAVAASQTTELLQHLRVDTGRMLATLGTSPDVLGERRMIGGLLDHRPDDAPTSYLGAIDLIVAGAVARASSFLEESS